MLKKILTWLVLAVAVLYVIRSPDSAAVFLRTTGDDLGSAVSSLASFVSSLVQGH